MSKVFLGGTCNESTWRQELIPFLQIDYFNPVVDDWTPECQAEEEKQKNEICDIHLYVITPRMTGVFSIAEIIESSHDNNKTTVVYILNPDGELEFTKGQLKSLDAVCRLAAKHNAIIANSFQDLINVLNTLI